MNVSRLGERVVLRDVHTPEGVSIPFEVATAGERINAFLIDIVVVHGFVVAIWILGAISGLAGGTVGLSLAILASFLIRNFYFVLMELRWGGQTVGKRKLHLRVISRDGGPLTSEAILARNLTRDMEVFLPLTALVEPGWLTPGATGWAILASTAWLILVALLPLFNRDRLRAGDIVGGTLVVRTPRPVLLEDLAGTADPVGAGRPEPGETPGISFTIAQLDLYGIRELQVLEDVLRFTEHQQNPELVERVCEQIRKKIGWENETSDARAFLLAFYRAQRGRLEQRMLFGERRESKQR